MERVRRMLVESGAFGTEFGSSTVSDSSSGTNYYNTDNYFDYSAYTAPTYNNGASSSWDNNATYSNQGSNDTSGSSNDTSGGFNDTDGSSNATTSASYDYSAAGGSDGPPDNYSTAYNYGTAPSTSAYYDYSAAGGSDGPSDNYSAAYDYSTPPAYDYSTSPPVSDYYPYDLGSNEFSTTPAPNSSFSPAGGMGQSTTNLNTVENVNCVVKSICKWVYW